jgi:selenocysteine lyase/cysteine desulfurase
MNSHDKWFAQFRTNIIGNNYKHQTPYGDKEMIYADWIASGRLYKPIEKAISEKIGPYVANTHTESSTTGMLMTEAYHYAKKIIKCHVNANDDDIIINAGFGMTAAIVKLQRLMGLKVCGKLLGKNCLDKSERPVVFITHMEHHSNQTSWYETVADVEIIAHDKNLLVDLNDLEEKLIKFKDRKHKIGAFTACSNVTGVFTPYHKMAALMHKYDGLVIIDFAASAPYKDIDMHPENPDEYLDAICFSPHKFLGGPGSSGILIFNKKLYENKSPDVPGGGTVEWTNPWGEYQYISDIEVREDGGTPGFLQCMRTAMAIKLKEKMNPSKIQEHENFLLDKVFKAFDKIQNLHILADNIRERLGVVSFYFDNMHYNLVVKLLSDRYGIQVRGGCACAGTYGHYLLDVSQEMSKAITTKISSGDLSDKPGWIRLSLHQCMTENEIDFILNAITEISKNYNKFAEDYEYNPRINEFYHIDRKGVTKNQIVKDWFDLKKTNK